MLGPIVRWKLATEEKRLGVSLDYLRHMYEHAPDVFRQFIRVNPLASYRQHLPAAPFHVARIASTVHDDCGTCVQIAVNLAKADGIETDVIRATVEARPADLPESLADVYRFATAIVAATGEEEQYRDRLRQVFGETGLAELAMAISFGRVFPTMKRALGFATSCARVSIEL